MRNPGRKLSSWTQQQLDGVEGTSLKVHGTTVLELSTPDGEILHQEANIVESLTTGAILGLHFLSANSAIVNLVARELTLRDGEYTLPLYGVDHGSSTCASTAVVFHQVSIPSGSGLEVMARVLGTPARTCLLESTQRHQPLEVARGLVDPTEGTFPVRLLNHSAAGITMYDKNRAFYKDCFQESMKF